MNSEIAKSRISEVMKVDTITTEQYDFMATHVPVTKLYLLNKCEDTPEETTFYSEEQVYQNIVRNPGDQHQFVIVYGASGAGKSHLIRWFSTKLKSENIENESVIFISRNDNSLKGTIRQLLDLPEIKNMPNRDIYKRLTDATSVVNENVLKRTIYAKFHILIQDSIDKSRQSIDQSDNPYDELSNVDKKRLIAYLKDDRVEERALQTDGPVSRIYSKLAGNSQYVDRDTIAEFNISDFAIDGRFRQRLADSDRKAQAFADKLASDDEGTFRRKVVRYINTFVSPVIQQCANLEPGDFEQIFTDIRKELYKQGKNLTLLIEDITSFTGVDQSLLNALMTPHTGIYASEKMCRVSSIIGTTTVYFRNNFYDNHKMRVTKFINIPTNQFSGNGLYEFVGKYMNTVSLTHDDLKPWIESNYRDSDYPVAPVVEGEGWDTVYCSNGKNLNLYPFTKKAIINLVNQMQPSQRTPRYILSEILEPILQDAIYNKDHFPSKALHLSLANPDRLLRRYIINTCGDNEDLVDRLINLTGIWGNNDHTCIIRGNHKIIAGLDENIYKSLNLPIIDIPETNTSDNNIPTNSNSTSKYSPNSDLPSIAEDNVPVQKEPALEKSVSELDEDNKEQESDQLFPELSTDTQNKIAKAQTIIEDWVRGDQINIASTQGENGIISHALKNLNDYLYSVINWQCYSISNDELSRFKNSSYRLVGLENQSKGNGNSFYIMKANRHSQEVFECFIRYQVAGKETWKYRGSENDIYTISCWTYEVKNDIAKAVKGSNGIGMNTYQEAAIALDMVRMILNGTITAKTALQGITEEAFFDDANMKALPSNEKHCKEWSQLLNDIICKDNMAVNTRKVVNNCFNLIQGNVTNTTIFFINYIDFNKALRRVKNTKLQAEAFHIPDNECVKQRKNYYEQLQKVLDRLDKVAESEKKTAIPYLNRFQAAFEVDSIAKISTEMILDFANEAMKFYNTIIENNVNVNVPENSQKQILNVKHAPGKIIAAYRTIENAVNDSDPTSVLLAFSSDPINEIIPIDMLITALPEKMANVSKDLKSKKDNIGFDPGQLSNYSNEQTILNTAKKMLANYEDMQ